MSVTLDQILALAGRLDDAPGFDAPRERFRRFLLDYARTVPVAITLIEECQHVPGEQHHRALEDLVVLLGRFVGFDVAFASRRPAPGGAGRDLGQWRSPGRLRILLDTRMDTTLAAASSRPDLPTAVLFVLTPLGVGRSKVDELVAAAKPPHPAGVVTLRALMSLARLASEGRITHDDVVRLVESSQPIDFIVDMLARSAGEAEAPATVPIDRHTGGKPTFWIATVEPDQGTTAEEFLELVVAKRRIFGVSDEVNVGPGDWICFHVAGKGVVGQARVAAFAGSGGLRGAHRFRQLLQLEDLNLHLRRPVAPDAETQLRWSAVETAPGRRAAAILEISAESFAALTSEPEASPIRPDLR